MLYVQGLVAVKRFRPSDVPRVFSGKRCSIAGRTMDLGDALLAYRGFDGLSLWLTEDEVMDREMEFLLHGAIASLSELEEVKRVFRTARRDEQDLLYCIVFDVARPVRKEDIDLPFFGFDFGFIQSPWSHFSVVLNEVVSGILEPMRRFSKYLNSHILFDTPELLKDLREQRYRLRDEHEGHALETTDGIPLVGVAVYDGSSFLP